ncbi:MAG TPA: T9SS type A sorting domain-containing protein [Chitinophagales bacterium]|nr:T9SS type A sorting domain-containing protein [Chitinophagales bacterium]
MKKFLPVFLMILFMKAAIAQSLVLNGDFESYIDCPSNAGQIENCVGWESVAFCGGYPTSPDYFNTCATSYLVTIPSNFAGYQYPHSGNGYSGVIPWVASCSNYREIIQAHLISPMQVGSEYYATMFMVATFDINFNVATNKMGIRFSTIPFSTINPVPINNWAHLYTDSVLYDTLNWIPFQGSFIADSAYEYILIGNFFDDQNTTLVQVGIGSSHAYCYIDDVCLVLNSDSCGIEATAINGLSNATVIKVFPNPSSDRLIVTDMAAQQKIIYLRNSFGKLVFQKKDFQGTKTLDLDVSKFPEGIYLLSVEEGEKMFSQSIIIQQ